MISLCCVQNRVTPATFDHTVVSCMPITNANYTAYSKPVFTFSQRYLYEGNLNAVNNYQKICIESTYRQDDIDSRYFCSV